MLGQDKYPQDHVPVHSVYYQFLFGSSFLCALWNLWGSVLLFIKLFAYIIFFLVHIASVPFKSMIMTICWMLILKDPILLLTVSNFYGYISQGLRVGLNLALAISLHNIPEVSSQSLVIDVFCFEVKYSEWMCCTTCDVASKYILRFLSSALFVYAWMFYYLQWVPLLTA